MKHRITLVESDEGWAVWSDDLPGCCSQGNTREEAIANIRDAIAEYIAAREDNLRLEPSVQSVQHEEILV